MNPRTIALGLSLALLAACKRSPPTPPQPRGARSGAAAAAAASSRPPFPANTLTTNARRDCFDPNFRTTRVRLRGTIVELCGLLGEEPRCYEVDPIANRVESVRVSDAPTVAAEEPRYEGPFERVELSRRGWHVSTRGGGLSVTGPAGNHRTVTPQQFGFHSYGDTVLLPWTDNWYAVLVGIRGDDLGATGVIDPFTLKMVSHSAILPCGRDL
ncbi:MAG: hypothetical protein U0324_46095 [Polyangiales bacterium]